MSRHQARSVISNLAWTCRQCQTRGKISQLTIPFRVKQQSISTSRSNATEVQIRAAPEITLDSPPPSVPARIIPSSPSYFTASPLFHDNLLHLQTLVRRHESLPTVSSDHAPRIVWMRLSQYRSQIGETISASKYSKVLALLTRLNRIHPRLRPKDVVKIMEQFRRPGSAEAPKPKPGKIDEYGRSMGVGRRKESSAKVYLVEGTGEVLVNGKSLVQVFPRLHDRESALWALKVTTRMDKYNVFALVEGGGVTGQAESITLALAKALLVQEPALKPALRRGKSNYMNLDGKCRLTLISGMCNIGCETSRAKEARSIKGKEEAGMGQEMRPRSDSDCSNICMHGIISAFPAFCIILAFETI
jgi:small subunit ribosomal protein S9